MVAHYRRSLQEKIFDFSNQLLMSTWLLIILLPIIYLVLISFATNAEVDRGAIIPTQFTLDAYRAAFLTPLLVNSYFVSIFVTLAGTFLSMLVTTMMAYGLSKKDLPGRRFLMMFVVVTMLVNTGLIPLYLVVRDAGLINSVWSLIIPSGVSAFNVILMKNFFLTIPEELKDAARLDGCNDFGVLFQVMLPLSTPAIATFTLFYAVSYWNSYFNAIMFINDPIKMPLQVIIRQMLIVEQIPEHDLAQFTQLPYPQNLRAAAVVLSIIPVLLVYPRLQRYFAQGILSGSIKD